MAATLKAKGLLFPCRKKKVRDSLQLSLTNLSAKAANFTGSEKRSLFEELEKRLASLALQFLGVDRTVSVRVGFLEELLYN